MPAGLAVLLALCGCSTTVVRENIIASVNTTVGATVMENDRTQLYEAKMGFIRHQFYSIPTGKTVGESNQMNNPRAVPPLLSGIRSESGVRQLLLGSDVSENFATGLLGVQSPAAVAMYISEAQTSAYASNALRGVRVVHQNFGGDSASHCLRSYWKPGGTVDAAHASNLTNWIGEHIGPNVEIAELLTGPEYVIKRRQAITAFGIHCD